MKSWPKNLFDVELHENDSQVINQKDLDNLDHRIGNVMKVHYANNVSKDILDGSA